jgi:serine/threonine protein kinase
VHDPADKLAFDLLFKLLELDPKKRLTSKEAIQDAYFDTLDPETKIKLDQGTI